MTMTSTTIMSAPFVLVVLLCRREQSDKGGHQDQENDRKPCEELLEVGEFPRRVHEG